MIVKKSTKNSRIPPEIFSNRRKKGQNKSNKKVEFKIHPKRSARRNVVTGIRLKRADIGVELEYFRPSPYKFDGAVILSKNEMMS